MENSSFEKDLHLFLFGNLEDEQKAESLLVMLKEVFSIEQLQVLLPRVRWFVKDL